MAINKRANNITISVNNTYSSNSKVLIKNAEYINVESTEKDLILASNLKISTLGKSIEKSMPKIEKK